MSLTRRGFLAGLGALMCWPRLPAAASPPVIPFDTAGLVVHDNFIVGPGHTVWVTWPGTIRVDDGPEIHSTTPIADAIKSAGTRGVIFIGPGTYEV